MHRWLSSGLAIFLSIVFVGCTNTTTIQQPQEPVAAEQVAKSVNRVVALTPLTADIIYQLDKTKIVGISGASLLNKDSRFQDIPRVSEGRTPPNLEKIVALKPDLVIGAEGFSNEITQKLQQLKIPTLLTNIKSWESLEELTKNLAQSINADPQPLLKRYQSFLPNQSYPSPSTLVLVSRQPISSPNKNSWAGDLLTKFNINSLTADLQGKSQFRGYVTLSAEKVLQANPQTLIVVNPPQGSNTALLDELKKEPFWRDLQATKKNRVYVFDYYGLVNPGSIDSIEKACKQLQEIISQG
jgi:iron complex transport system substrate-binding protein